MFHDQFAGFSRCIHVFWHFHSIYIDFNVGASNRPCLGCKLDFASGLKTHTSKKVFRPLCQNSLAETSTLAPSALFDVLLDNFSVDIGNNSGSSSTSLHTSFSNSPVRSRTSLCLIITNPPVAQDKA